MPDYQKGKVYRILQDNEKTVYIGSTTQELSARMGQHRKGPKQHPTLKLYKLMAEVGVDRFSIELIVDVPCDRREILNRAEGEQIRLHGTIVEGANQFMAGRTMAEYDHLPEVKAKRAARQRTPEYKTKAAAYKQIPEYKTKAAARQQTPEYKTKRAEYTLTPEYKANNAERQQTPEYKAKAAERQRLARQRKRAAAVEAIVEPVDAAPV